jgi:hypothetical protein
MALTIGVRMALMMTTPWFAETYRLRLQQARHRVVLLLQFQEQVSQLTDVIFQGLYHAAAVVME